MLAALEPNCSCALLPLCYIIFNGHGIRSASSQVNSKTFPIPPVSVQVIVLPLPRLIVCCGCIRCFWLRVPLQEGLSYPIQSLGIRLLGRKVGLEPTTSKDGEPSILPTELLASKNNYKTIQDIVVGGSSELQKTSTEMILINNELDIFL